MKWSNEIKNEMMKWNEKWYEIKTRNEKKIKWNKTQTWNDEWNEKMKWKRIKKWNDEMKNEMKKWNDEMKWK